jgi:hypothetical protein
MNVGKSKILGVLYKNPRSFSGVSGRLSLFPGVLLGLEKLENQIPGLSRSFTNPVIIMNNNRGTGVITAHYWMFGRT